MTVRSATPKDASRLAEILIFAKRAAYRPIFQNDAVSFNEMQVLNLALEFRSNPEALRGVYVYDDGIVKGMMRWDRSLEDRGQWQLKELYIDPFFQRQGIGSALMESFMDNAGRRGMGRVFLWVLEENERAKRFYSAFGFQPEGGRELQPGTDKYVLKYEKML